jgi:hypothetical protein
MQHLKDNAMNNIKDFINMTSLYNEYTLLEATSQELAKGLYDAGAGKMFGTDEEAIFDLLDQIKSKEEFDAVVKSYKVRARGDDLITDLQDEMSGQELETLNTVLDRVSADNFGTAPGTEADLAAREAAADLADAEAAAAADNDPADQIKLDQAVVDAEAEVQAAQDELAATDTAQTGTDQEDTDDDDDANAAQPSADDDNPRPTGNEEGDPYGIKNAQQAVDNGQGFRLADLNRAKQELASDQAEWDAENPGQVPPTTADTINTDTSNVKFSDIGAAMIGRDQVVSGQTVEIDGVKAIATEYDGGGIYYVGLDGRAISGQTDNAAEPEVTNTAQTDANQAAATASADANDPRGDQTNPPARSQVVSPLATKLKQVTSANLMRDYNTGGKKPMDSIKQVQLALSRLGFDPNGIDGKYGPGTFKAVQQFQQKNNLPVDGAVGPNTIKSLQTALTTAANKTT